MKLDDIYALLSVGEFRQLFVGTGGISSTTFGEGIPDTEYTKIFPLVKLGLTELHKRFLLQEGTEMVTLVAEQAAYLLAATDILKVERIYGTYNEKQYEIPLNEIGNDASIRTSGLTSLVVPTDSEKAPWLLETTTLSVVYRADHAVIKDYKANVPSNTVINLLPTYTEPLLYFIASKYTNPKGMSSEFHEGNNYWSKFEAACALINHQGLAIETNADTSKLSDRGFV